MIFGISKSAYEKESVIQSVYLYWLGSGLGQCYDVVGLLLGKCVHQSTAIADRVFLGKALCFLLLLYFLCSRIFDIVTVSLFVQQIWEKRKRIYCRKAA
jgi:hypothetical protein